MQLLYFGWVRAKIGKPGEAIDRPEGVEDVAGLIAWLKGRGDGYAAALANLEIVRVAVNQELSGFDAPVRDGDEVAMFPPMTGG